MTIKETVERIQRAGVDNVRIATITGSNKVKIEILSGGMWAKAIGDIDRSIAEDIIRQATSRVILG